MELNELEQVVMDLKGKIDTILNTVDESEKKFNHDKGVSEFTERNKDTLGKYAETMKKLNGDDFDIYAASYDEYNDNYSDMEEGAYVAELVSVIDEKINCLKEALADGDIDEATHEAEEVAEKLDEAAHTDNETEEKVEEELSEKTEEPEEKEEEKKEESEEKAEEPAEEKSEETETESESNEDEMSEEEKEFIADLEADYDKYHKE